MMIEDRKTHKHYVNLMTLAELKVLRMFLLGERERHIDNIVNIEELVKYIDKKVKEDEPED